MKLIVCTNTNYEIGLNNDLLYSFKEDLSMFKKLTSSGDDPIVAMGRRTYDSIGKPLPNRKNIVLSQQEGLEIPGVEVMNIPEFIKKYYDFDNPNNIWIIGGAQVYEAVIGYVNEIYITRVVDNRTRKDSIHVRFFMDIRDQFKRTSNGSYFSAINRIDNLVYMIKFERYERY